MESSPKMVFTFFVSRCEGSNTTAVKVQVCSDDCACLGLVTTNTDTELLIAHACTSSTLCKVKQIVFRFKHEQFDEIVSRGRGLLM